MSVALLIEMNGEENISIPVATEVVFRRYWLPVCIELDFKWIPLFESGLPVSEQDRPFILEELHRFELWVLEHDIQPEIAERAKLLASTLRSINFGPTVSTYIG